MESLENKAQYFVEKLHYDLVIVFLDMVPANKNIDEIYTELRVLSKRTTEFKVIVIPVISSEFLFIKSLQVLSKSTGKKLICRDKDTYGLVDKLLNKQPFYDIESVREDPKFNKRFRHLEKLSKYVLENFVIECAEHNKKHKLNLLYNQYYNSACPCEFTTGVCGNTQALCLKEKAQTFVRQFPCYPLLDSYKPKLSIDDLWKIHRKAVDEFNELNEKFRNFEIQILEKYVCTNLDASRYSEKKLEYIK